MPGQPSALAQRLDLAQLEALWVRAGGSLSLAPTMAAIALAESGGNPSALNNNSSTGDYSVGLWQINYYGNLLSSRTQRYGPPSLLQSSPLANAKAAVDLAAGGSGLSNWTTYSSGAYRQYLGGSSGGPAAGGTGQTGGGQAQAGPLPRPGPLSGLDSSGVKAIIDAVAGGHLTIDQANSQYPGINLTPSKVQAAEGNFPTEYGKITGAFSSFFDFFTSWRFAEIVGGFALLLVGLILLGRQFGVNTPGSSLAARVPGA